MTYNATEFERQAQRFILPLYVKNELDGHEYSSTGTFVKYNERYYILMAAHALDGDIDLNDIYFFSTEGEFCQLIIFKSEPGYEVYEKQDLIVMDISSQSPIKGKNYFSLNENELIGFDQEQFSWIGFPSCKCKNKKVHKTKSPETLKQKFVTYENGKCYSKSNPFFIITSKIIENDRLRILGTYDRKNVELKYQGPVTKGPSPQGMSGGAMYQFAINQELKSVLDESFRFIGIGIEYNKENNIIGIAKPIIIKLIEQLNAKKKI